MTIVQWARSVKTDLVVLQQKTGIPAIWAAAQMCHESAINGGADLSDLATQAQNYAGLKWAEWERPFGCKPVAYGTWEVINGQDVGVTDAFCWCPSWQIWLQVYSSLLLGSFYGPAMTYKVDSLLYGFHVWQGGWATDPNYITKVAAWMTQIWPDYADTAPGAPPPAPPTKVTAVRTFLPGSGVVTGELRSDNHVWIRVGDVWARAQDIAEAMGRKTTWVPPDRGGPWVIVS